MVDLTILELHVDVDAEDLPFSERLSSTLDRPTDIGPSRPPGSAESGLRDRAPTRLLVGVGVLMLAIGGLVAVKRFRGDDDDLAEAF